MAKEKRLILVRHAKSSWKDASLNDIQRPLNKRGNKDAPKMGKHLSDIEAIPDVIFSSPGLRALTTARLIAVEIGIKPKDIVLKDDLYTFSHSDLLEFICSMDDKYATVMLVGHNPAITDTLNFLCGTNIDNVPTCGVAIMKLSVDSWGKLNKNKAELLSFDYPKKLW